MSSKTVITIDPWDPKSYDRAIYQVNQFKKKLENQLDELCKRLAEFGKIRAAELYSNALYAGTNDVQVDVFPGENGTCVLLAWGDALFFIEFGTGILYEDDSWQARNDINVSLTGRGQFGYHLGSLPDGWRYHGDPGNLGQKIPEGEPHAGEIHTYGNPSALAMWRTREEMISSIKSIAKEVFK